MPSVNDKLLIKVGGEYKWAVIERIITDVYTIPVFNCRVLHGKYENESVSVTNYLERAASGVFISHELPAACNA